MKKLYTLNLNTQIFRKQLFIFCKNCYRSKDKYNIRAPAYIRG